MKFASKLYVFSAIAFLSVALAAGVGALALHKNYAAAIHNEAMLGALKNHLEADTMHNALRADVLAALLAGAGGDRKAEAGIRNDLSEHSQWFRKVLEANSQAELDADTKAAFAAVRPLLDRYVAAAERILPLAFAEPRQAQAAWPNFMA